MDGYLYMLGFKLIHVSKMAASIILETKMKI